MQKFHYHYQFHHAKIHVVTNLADMEADLHSLVQDFVFTIENFVETHKDWELSFDPVSSGNDTPLIVAMEKAGQISHVGPMAAVAGAIADALAQVLIQRGSKITIVENGGEILIHSEEDANIGIFSETTSLKGNLGVKYQGGQGALGIGTSSGQFGHALSLGTADIVTVFAENAALADAAATYVANHVKGETAEDAINSGLEGYRTLQSARIFGALLHKDTKIGTIGKLPPLIQISKY